MTRSASVASVPRLLALAGLAACSRSGPELHVLQGPTMGSTYSVKWHGAADPAAVAAAVAAELDGAEATFSNWRSDSELQRFQAHRSTAPWPASAALREAVDLALRLAAVSGGAFDPTVKPLLDLYRQSKQSGEAPAAAAVAVARERVGHSRLRREGEALVKAREDVEVDLDGLVAGLVADRIGSRLEALGVHDFLLDITGEILCRGSKPGGAPWRVGIVDPARADADRQSALLDFPLRDRALCTSGDYRNYTIAGGRVLTHVFDPRTGDNPRHGVVSVSVLARSCALADGLATALMVLGPEQAAELLRACGEDGVGAWFVLASPEGTLRAVAVGWPEAFALDGRPLLRPALGSELQQEREAALAAAREGWSRAPDDRDAAVWVGRRLAYLGRFRDAIACYTEALLRHPDDPWLLRHRGHRHLTLRDFAAAERDFARAAELVRDRPDEVEPDGLPTPGRPPHSSLHFNIHYHLGLVRFLQRDFAGAEQAFSLCLAASRHDEARVAAAHWLWCAQMHQGRTAAAAATVAPFDGDLDVVENRSYLRLCRLYRGELQPGDFTFGPELDAATAFGLANYLWCQGSREQAGIWLRAVASRPDWPSFGVLAAEAALQPRLAPEPR